MTTPPKTKKLFISYRSSDAAKVDKIARDLASLTHDDGTPRYLTWQDKHNLPPASPNWWDAIVDAITDCDMFVFHLSRESLQSAVCRAELDYAHKRNRPIIPVVIEGEFFLNVATGKYDLPQETWALVPAWMRDRQLLFYIEELFTEKFQEGVDVFERNWPRDLPTPRPLNPDETSAHSSNHALYDAACDYAERLAFEEAEKYFGALVTRNDRDYADFAAQWIEIIRKYAELLEIASRRSARVILKARVAEYRALFPKMFIDADIFDPKGLVFSEPPLEEIAAEKAETDHIAREKAEADRVVAQKEAEELNHFVAKLVEETEENWFLGEQVETKWTSTEDEYWTSIFINQLQDSDPVTRNQAAMILSNTKDTRAVEPLIAALKDEFVSVRWNAAEALGNIGDARAVEPLIALLQDENEVVRKNTYAALQRIGTPKAKLALLRRRLPF